MLFIRVRNTSEPCALLHALLYFMSQIWFIADQFFAKHGLSLYVITLYFLFLTLSFKGVPDEPIENLFMWQDVNFLILFSSSALNLLDETYCWSANCFQPLFYSEKARITDIGARYADVTGSWAIIPFQSWEWSAFKFILPHISAYSNACFATSRVPTCKLLPLDLNYCYHWLFALYLIIYLIQNINSNMQHYKLYFNFLVINKS
jgi:hypothetical protein